MSFGTLFITTVYSLFCKVLYVLLITFPTKAYIIKIINPGIIIVVKHSLLSVSIRNNSFLTIINILLISVLLLYYNTLQKKHPLMIFLFLFLKYYLHIPIYHLLQCLLYQQLFQPLQIYVLKL